MSEYMFGVGRGELTRRERSIAERVAKKCGASFVGNPRMPGQGYQYWFTSRNLGEPFNGRLAREVAAELKAAGWTRGE